LCVRLWWAAEGEHLSFSVYGKYWNEEERELIGLVAAGCSVQRVFQIVMAYVSFTTGKINLFFKPFIRGNTTAHV
jgi:hypothetical protein